MYPKYLGNLGGTNERLLARPLLTSYLARKGADTTDKEVVMARFWFLMAAALVALCGYARPAAAGCGCNKPAPPLEAIRPHFAPPGWEIQIFHPALVEGKRYKVTFVNAAEPESDQQVGVRAVVLRDFADGVLKPQLRVMVPPLSVGPTFISIRQGPALIAQFDDSQFTALPPPVALQEVTNIVEVQNYQAAVDTQGVVYLAFDITDIAKETLFSGIGFTYPLLFDASDVAIYNSQGFLMQLLGVQNSNTYSIDDEGTPHSFRLTYDRHEFETYRQRHVDDPGWQPDPADPSWHVDGSAHIDHDHLILAISGILEDGTTPAPGATPAFDLSVTTVVNPTAAAAAN